MASLTRIKRRRGVCRRETKHAAPLRIIQTLDRPGFDDCPPGKAARTTLSESRRSYPHHLLQRAGEVSAGVVAIFRDED